MIRFVMTVLVVLLLASTASSSPPQLVDGLNNGTRSRTADLRLCDHFGYQAQWFFDDGPGPAEFVLTPCDEDTSDELIDRFTHTEGITSIYFGGGVNPIDGQFFATPRIVTGTTTQDTGTQAAPELEDGNGASCGDYLINGCRVAKPGSPGAVSKVFSWRLFLTPFAGVSPMPHSDKAELMYYDSQGTHIWTTRLDAAHFQAWLPTALEMLTNSPDVYVSRADGSIVTGRRPLGYPKQSTWASPPMNNGCTWGAFNCLPAAFENHLGYQDIDEYQVFLAEPQPNGTDPNVWIMLFDDVNGHVRTEFGHRDDLPRMKRPLALYGQHPEAIAYSDPNNDTADALTPAHPIGSSFRRRLRVRNLCEMLDHNGDGWYALGEITLNGQQNGKLTSDPTCPAPPTSYGSGN